MKNAAETDPNTGKHDRTDPTNEPDPVVCDCGGVYAWTWFDPERAMYTPRWTSPRVNPCEVCAEQTERLERQAALSQAQRHAGIPQRLRHYRLDKIRHQGSAAHSAFVSEIKGTRGLIGLTADCAPAYLAIRDWNPARQVSFFLSGGVGTGKSLLCAALATQLLQGAPRRWAKIPRHVLVERHGERAADIAISMGRDNVLTGSRRFSVKYTTEAELLRRVKLGWSGDKDPLLKAYTECDVLILDDIGTATMGTDKQRAFVTEQIERLVCRRYEDEAPIFMTSNLSWDELVTERRYGARVSDRLREMTSDIHSMGTQSWR